ncbi:LamG domain-containing protein [Ralstonia thomasii]
MIPAFTRYRNGSSAGDPYFANVALLLHADGANGSTTFTDSSPVAHSTPSVTGSVSISSTNPKFGSGCVKFNGSGGVSQFEGFLDYTADSSLTLGTGDFTIEAWVNIASNPSSYYGLFDYRPDHANGAYFSAFIDNSGRPILFVNNNTQIVAASPISLNQYHHLAYVRRSGVSTLYVDGTASGSSYTDSNNYGGARLRVGGSGWDGSLCLGGLMDDIRITNTVGRYNGTFTPTGPFPDHA